MAAHPFFEIALTGVERRLHFALDRSFADAEAFRDRLVAQLRRDAQQEHLPAAHRQTEQRPLHDSEALLDRDDAFRRRRIVR